MPVAALKVADAALRRAEAKALSLLAALSAPDVAADAEHRLIDELCSTLEWIYRAEPQSLRGAAVKLRVLLHPELGAAACESPDELREPLAQVLQMVERSAPSSAKRAGARTAA